jgi:hypothetical protein
MTNTLRNAVLLVLTALGLSFVTVVAPSSPAWACSCVRRAEAERLADLTVTGTVTSVTDRTVKLAVDGVEKGEHADTTLTLAVGRSESSCGFGFRTGVRYRVNSAKGATGLCLGIDALPALPAAETTSTPAAATAPAPAGAVTATMKTTSMWLAGGAGSVIVVIGLVAVVIRRRRTA